MTHARIILVLQREINDYYLYFSSLTILCFALKRRDQNTIIGGALHVNNDSIIENEG